MPSDMMKAQASCARQDCGSVVRRRGRVREVAGNMDFGVFFSNVLKTNVSNNQEIYTTLNIMPRTQKDTLLSTLKTIRITSCLKVSKISR